MESDDINKDQINLLNKYINLNLEFRKNTNLGIFLIEKLSFKNRDEINALYEDLKLAYNEAYKKYGQKKI